MATFTATSTSHTLTVRATAQMNWGAGQDWNETSRDWDAGIDYHWLADNKDTAITFSSTDGDATMTSSVDTSTGTITLNFSNTDNNTQYTISIVGEAGEQRDIEILTMDGATYSAPALVYGDPHIVTLDGVKYTL